MKIQIGQRRDLNPDLRDGVQLLKLFTLKGPSSKKIVYEEFCGGCSSPVNIELSEDENGAVWIEGPDKCIFCGKELFDKSHNPDMMDQSQIKAIFGPF